MKVLLTTINSQYIHQNLAIRLLYALNKEYEGLHWKEFVQKDDVQEMASYCAAYDVVAFSCYIWNMEKVLQVAATIKQQHPRCTILLGGPEVTYEWEDIVALPEVDFIITGEGELSFSSFLKHFPAVENVPSLIWKKNGQVMHNAGNATMELALFENINPYIFDNDADLRHKICYVETTRGCPYSCSFCLAGLKGKVRIFPLEMVFRNLQYVMKRAGMIKFLDRTFNFNQQHAIAIFEFILKHRKPWNTFQFEIKADDRQAELIAFIRNKVPKGIFRFEIGIQTLNSKANAASCRRQNFENIKEFISQVSDIVEIHLDLIAGLPYDTYADIRHSFDEVFKIAAPELQLGILKFLKGAPIRRDAEAHHYKYHLQPPYQIIESDYLTAGELRKIAVVERALDVYWNRKRAIFTLKYVAQKYATFDFFYGLGCSFEKQFQHGKYNVIDIFGCVLEFVKQYFPNDMVLQELIAVDYYLYCKVKPAPVFLAEVAKPSRRLAEKRYGLNLHRYRYLILPLHFDFKRFQRDNNIIEKEELLIIQYNGIEPPQIKNIVA